jgi:cation transporter-like permease
MSSVLVRDSTPQDREENEKAAVVQRPTRRDVLDRYLIRLEKNPLLTRCLTYAVVGGLGALVGARTATSKHSRKPQKVDWLEVLSFTFHGGLIAGPISHYW